MSLPENAAVLPFYLSLGSNVGEREKNLAIAVDRLNESDLPIRYLSSVYETEPVGGAAGPVWFLNLAVGGETDLGARQILDRCLSIECALGRRRSIAGGPREIDIDLLLLADQVVAEACCEVPHPRMHLRRFVLEPLAEIALAALHPVLGLTVDRMLERLTDASRVVKRGRLRESSGAAVPK